MISEGTVVARASFPEGLRWRNGELWFSDMRTREVVCVAPPGPPAVRAYIPGQPSGLGWTPAGTLLVASMLDRALIGVENGRRVPVASLAHVAKGAVNDMLVDRAGRAYVGSIGYDPVFDPFRDDLDVRESRTALALVDPSGAVSVAADDLGSPNGMALLRDGSMLVVAESFRDRLTAFDVDSAGQLHNRRVFAAVEGTPDGICADRDDAVWVALTRREKFVRVREGGEVLDEVSVPGRIALDCELGGPAGRTLFTAVTHTDTAIWTTGEVGGEVGAWTVETPGVAGSEAAGQR